MGTKGPKAGNIFTSLRSRGLVGGQGQDPSIKGMGSPFKQTQPNEDGRDGSLYGSLKRAFKRNALNDALERNPSNWMSSLGKGKRKKNIKGPGGNPPPTPPNENSKAVLESEKKGDEAINDKMKVKDKDVSATPLKKCGCGKKKCNC